MMGQAGMDGGRRANGWRVAGWGAAAALLALPAVAMQVGDQVRWGPGDFLLFAALLGGVGGALELAVRRTGSRAYRAATALALAGAFLLVWASLAVGVIGREDDPANLLFAGVLGVGVIGAVAARFRPAGMARAMAATALAHAAASLGALATGRDVPLAATVLFVMLWLGSAWAFRRAALNG